MVEKGLGAEDLRYMCTGKSSDWSKLLQLGKVLTAAYSLNHIVLTS